MRTNKGIFIGAGSSVLMAGCAVSPSLNVLGAFFPDWLFCMMFGLAMTLIVRTAMMRKRREAVAFLPVVYTTLMVFFSMLFWVVIFE